MAKRLLVSGMSRTGTTLLTTVLDSHPRVSMGYELMPGALPPYGDTVDVLSQAVEASGGAVDQCVRELRARGAETVAGFARRAARALVQPARLLADVQALALPPDTALDSVEMRTRLSMLVADRKRAIEGTEISGFKVNVPSVALVDRYLGPEATYVHITRDPRDVVASHFANDFGRTLEEIMRAWVNYGEQFEKFAADHPERTLVVRYEDLVHRPGEVVSRVCEVAALDFHPSMLDFAGSKASVHGSGHVNDRQLRSGFFVSSVGRWQTALSREQVHDVQASGRDLMTRQGYRLAPAEPPAPMPAALRAKKRKELDRKKVFYRDQYERLLAPYRDGFELRTWAEATEGADAHGQDVLVIRHDIDHDFETAVKMAHWEHARGIRATYCVLHSAWYYGEERDGTLLRYREPLDAALEIQSLGHEVNLHNNAVTVALRARRDPVEVLWEELAHLRMHGLRVVGTSTHGDALCRELDYRNYEVFAECVYASRGGARSIEWEGHPVALGRTPMAELGLRYEGYDLPRDLYLTDSGGNLRIRRHTRGRAGLARERLEGMPNYGRIVGILTHPVWWDFDHDAPSGAPLALLDDPMPEPRGRHSELEES